MMLRDVSRQSGVHWSQVVQRVTRLRDTVQPEVHQSSEADAACSPTRQQRVSFVLLWSSDFVSTLQVASLLMPLSISFNVLGCFALQKRVKRLQNKGHRGSSLLTASKCSWSCARYVNRHRWRALDPTEYATANLAIFMIGQQTADIAVTD